MSAILIPEVLLNNSLNSIIKLIRTDLLKNAADETKTILYKLLGEDEEGAVFKMNNYIFYKQAKKIFSNPQNLSINLGYNPEAAKIISLHILLPSESSVPTSLGSDEGYMENETENTFTQLFKSTYQIMITSDNSSETMVVYSVLKAMLIAITPHLETMGLRIPEVSGNDIVMQNEYAVASIFHKVLNISFTYELTVPQLYACEIAKSFKYQFNVNDYVDEK